jgi:ribosomal protein S18 acetylase RimI-like enzyme
VSVLVRPGVVDDVPLLADLTARSFDGALHPYLTVAQAGAARFLALALTHPHLHPGRELLVAVSEEAVVGYADIRTSPEGDAFLSYLCVVEEARGRGVATTLLDAFREERRPRSLALDVFTSNAPANALYDRMGFGRGPLSTWVARPLPAAAAAPAPVEAFASQHATHETYGFSQFRTDE